MRIIPFRRNNVILTSLAVLLIISFSYSVANSAPPDRDSKDNAPGFSVNLVIGGMSEETEAGGGVIRVNTDFDEENRNANGNPLADYQPDEKEGHRIVGDDPNLMDGSLLIGGTEKGEWRLVFPENTKVWRKKKGGKYVELISSRFSKKVKLPFSCEFKVEGIKASQFTNDVRILAEFTPAKSKETYRDSVFLTVLETQFAVTFDDGPLPEKTDKIVRALNNFYHNGQRVRAAFFHVGVKVKKFGDLTQFVHQHGHLVLNHTHYHAHFGYRMLNDEEIRDDIVLCEEEIRRVLGREPEKIIRSRALREDMRFEKEARILGYEFCTGELIDDWEASSVEEIQTRAEEILKSWNTREDPRQHPYPAILIFHEFPELTYDHIGEIISHLQDRGFVLVSFDPDLIY